MRGWIDRLWGGPGLRRGRRSPYDLQLGDAVDFWRVEDIVDGELLRLRAEMKLPGRAWLDLGIERDDADGTLFHQRAVFAPKGLLGRAYWWSVWPVPRARVRRHAAQHRPPGRGARRRGDDAGRQPRWRRPRSVVAARALQRQRRTVVVTATIDGRRGVELKPKRTGGSTWRERAEVDVVPRRRDGVDGVAVGGARRTRRPPGVSPRVRTPRSTTRATGSIDRRPRGLVATGRGTARSAQPSASRRPIDDVGDERTAREPQQVARARSVVDRRHDELVELVHRRHVGGDLVVGRDEHPAAVGVLDHGVGERAERRLRPATDHDARPARRAEAADLAAERVLSRSRRPVNPLRSPRGLGAVARRDHPADRPVDHGAPR